MHKRNLHKLTSISVKIMCANKIKWILIIKKKKNRYWMVVGINKNTRDFSHNL